MRDGRKNKEFFMRKSNAKKRIVVFAFIVLMAMNFVFATGTDDFGFGEYLGKIQSFLTAIGAALILIALGTWAAKAIITKDISPKDWKAIAIVAGAGILLIVAPSVIKGIFGSELGAVPEA